MNILGSKLGCSVSVACLLALATPAMAQNYDISGFYLGAAVGGATLGGDYSTDDSTDSGVVVGVYAGYNFVVGNMVYGVEADYNIAEMYLCEQDCDGDRNYVSVDSMASIRGRIGMTFDNVFIYGTAGVGGIAGQSVSSTDGDDGAISATGIPVVGIGAELAISDTTSFRAEYLSYLVNGTRLFGDGPDFNAYSNLDVVRVGFTMRF